MELSNRSLVAQAHNHLQDLKFYIGANEKEYALERIDMVQRISDTLNERLTKQGE